MIMDSGFIIAGMPVSVVTCCLRPVRCRRLFARLQHCISGWGSRKQQYSLCTGEIEGLGFLTCISFCSPLKVKRVDEVIVVKKEIQGVRRERLQGESQGSCQG